MKTIILSFSVLALVSCDDNTLNAFQMDWTMWNAGVVQATGEIAPVVLSNTSALSDSLFEQCDCDSVSFTTKMVSL